MNRVPGLLAMVVCSLTLAACGGHNDDDDMPAPAPATPPPRGSLIESPPARTASLTPDQIAAALTNAEAAQLLLDLIVAPKCGIDIHHVEYNTVDPADDRDDRVRGDVHSDRHRSGLPGPASDRPLRARHRRAALAEPRRHHERGQSRRPARGDDVHDAGLHPDRAQLHGLRHVRAHLQPVSQRRPGSEGHDRCADRVAQRAADELRADGHGLRQAVRHGLLAGRPRRDGDSQDAAGNRRNDHGVRADVRVRTPSLHSPMRCSSARSLATRRCSWCSPRRATRRRTATCTPVRPMSSNRATPRGSRALLPSAVPRSQLFADGKLPRDQLFDSTPPDPSFAQFTPATSPANLASVFAQGFGPDHLVTNAFRLAYLQDAQAQSGRQLPHRARQPARGECRERTAARVRAQRSAHVGTDRTGVPVRRRRRSDRALLEHADDPGVLGRERRDGAR